MHFCLQQPPWRTCLETREPILVPNRQHFCLVHNTLMCHPNNISVSTFRSSPCTLPKINHEWGLVLLPVSSTVREIYQFVDPGAVALDMVQVHLLHYRRVFLAIVFLYMYLPARIRLHQCIGARHMLHNYGARF
jgi:hypothetical protein